MKTYKNKETREIKTFVEIQREHNELIHNTSINIEDIKDIEDIDDYISEYYDEIDIDGDEWKLNEIKEKIAELENERDEIMGNYPIGYFDYLF
jgi:archaellum component FlaC